jgi:hypothetical protein
VGVRPEPDRDKRADDEQALDEIRRRFARYRQIARHGQVTEHDKPADAPGEDAHDATASLGR